MQPSFDTWTSGFLFAVVMGLFLFVILITSRNKRNFPIAFLILSFSIILFRYVFYWTGYDKVYFFLNLIDVFCYYLTGPLLYLYFLNLYKKRVTFNYLFHFFPAFVLLIPNVALWLKLFGLDQIKIPFVFLIRGGQWYMISHMIIYTTLIFVLIFKNKDLNTEYTRVRFNWSKVLIFLYTLFIISLASYYVFVKFSFFNAEWDYMISMMMSISIYTIGYFIFKQPRVFDGEFFSNLFLPVKNKDETFETSMLNEFYDNVTSYMEHQKPYIDNELRLVNLADQVGFSTHLLSKIINKKSGKNFNNFVNEYRLKEAKELLLSKDYYNIKSIYFDVGFNNKTTFYKAFKRKFNCTPLEFKEEKKY